MMKIYQKHGELLRILAAVAVTLSLCYAYSGRQVKVAHAQDENAEVLRVGRDLARCLSSRDWNGLGGITESPYLTKVRPQLEQQLQAQPGQFKCLNKSIQILDSDTACLYLKCTTADVKYLCMVTCSKLNGQWKISCFVF